MTRRVVGAVVGMGRACHPGPTLAVTSVALLLATTTTAEPGVTWGAALAVGLGQLSIGWSNDAHDRHVDQAAGRTDKPIVAGQVGGQTVWLAAHLALVASVVASVVVAGPVGGGAHVVAVLVAWAYNLGLSRTTWSIVPYVVSFGLLPVFLVAAGPEGARPAGWAVTAFAAVAGGAHLVNGLRDLEIDRRAGLGGTVVWLGAGPARWVATGLFAVAALAVAAGARDAHPTVGVGLPVATVVLLVPGPWLGSPTGRFRGVLVGAVVLVLLLVAAILGGQMSLVAGRPQ